MNMFSELIFEAIIVDIIEERGVCSLNPFDVNSDSVIDNVKLPYFAGTGNAGIFMGFEKGTRVVAAYTAGHGRESAVILMPLHQEERVSGNFDPSAASDIRSGVMPYPKMKTDKMVLRGGEGAEAILKHSGDVILKVGSGGGIRLRKNQIASALSIVSEDISYFSQSGRMTSGSVDRIAPGLRSHFPKESFLDVPLFADTFHALLGRSVGFFTGSRALKETCGDLKRNPELAEHKLIINEFTTDSMFTGFGDEVNRFKGDIKLFDKRDSFQRNREQSNSLHLAEHELIEIIGGNLVDINGNVLDINYRTLSYGSAENKVPKGSLELNYDTAKRISRRGIGFHFQLATNTKKSDPSTYQNNFAFDVDKEGLLKVNIPRSSDTGNIPFSSNADYLGANNSVDVSVSNPSKFEKIPALLRDKNGEAIVPANISGDAKRETGIRYSNDQKNPYFPSVSESGVSTYVRVNPTKYHNMYAAGERLLANQIKDIHIPESFVNNHGVTSGNMTGKPFEIPVPEESTEGETSDTAVDQIGDITAFLSDPASLVEKIKEITNDDGYPSYMSTVGVEPAPPAIYSGGDTVVGGFVYEADNEQAPSFSNLFSSELEGANITTKIVDASGNKASQSGGKSANLQLQGSVEMSVGKDNEDQKSILLDTDGSVVSWIGQDKHGRSIVTQTDGEVCMNIGGSYENQDSESPSMNIGRLTIRVNVTNKGFVDSQFDADADDEDGPKNPKGGSDFIIDISENGLVIAGMVPDKPMIIRNSGKLLLESADTLVLKSNQVQILEADGKPKTIRSGKR